MGISIRPSRALFAAVMIGLGIIGLIYGNSALIWEPIPKTLPDRPVIIYLCAVIEIGTGIGLLLRPSVILACRVLFPFLLLWMALLKLPGLFLAPHVMVSWEAFGEIAATSAGAGACSPPTRAPGNSGISSSPSARAGSAPPGCCSSRHCP